jgi:hypothetical protein
MFLHAGSCPEHDCRCNLNTYGNPIRRSFASSSETRQCFAVDIDMYSNHLHVSLNSSMEGAVVRARSALDHKARCGASLPFLSPHFTLSIIRSVSYGTAHVAQLCIILACMIGICALINSRRLVCGNDAQATLWRAA